MSVVSIPIGFRFIPTKEEVIVSYLRPAINGEPLPADVLLKIDIYGDKREPWNLFDKDSEHSFWVFTKLKKKNGSVIDRVAGCGSWVNQYFDEIRNSDGKLLGYDTYFRFEWKKDGQKLKRGNNGYWTMHEFSLSDEGLTEYVICEIKNKDSVIDGKARPRKTQNSANIDDVNEGMSATKNICVDRAILDHASSSTSQINYEGNNLNFGEFVHEEYHNQIMDHRSQTMVMNSCSPQGNYTDTNFGQPKVISNGSSPVEFTNGSVSLDFNDNEAMNLSLKSFVSELEDLLSAPASADDECNIGSSINNPTTHAVNSGFGETYNYEENVRNPNSVDQNQTMIRNCNPLQESQGRNFKDNGEMNLKPLGSELEGLLSAPVSADECDFWSSICATTDAVNSGFGEPYDQENQDPNLVDDETMFRISNPFLF